ASDSQRDAGREERAGHLGVLLASLRASGRAVDGSAVGRVELLATRRAVGQIEPAALRACGPGAPHQHGAAVWAVLLAGRQGVAGADHRVAHLRDRASGLVVPGGDGWLEFGAD